MNQSPITTQHHPMSLSGLLNTVKSVISNSFPDYYWVIAEVSQISHSARGHIYMDLVEKEADQKLAQVKGNIWSGYAQGIVEKFENETRESLKAGMQILLQAKVEYHTLYGLSLTVRDIDPSYSLGELARRKRQTIERLEKEGSLEKNKRIELPLVLQNIAVISSKTAAGYSDFINQLESNRHKYIFSGRLFNATMQGDGAKDSIVIALGQIEKYAYSFDAIVLIRGGGSQLDLSCFDDYELCKHLANSSLPIITGIGHQQDDTVADLVGKIKLKTPTAVAEYIIDRNRQFEESLLNRCNEVIESGQRIISRELSGIKNSCLNLAEFIRKITASQSNLITHLETMCIRSANETFKTETMILDKESRKLPSAVAAITRSSGLKLESIYERIRLLDPREIMKRGYSLTLVNRKILKSTKDVCPDDELHTVLADGTIKSKVI